MPPVPNFSTISTRSGVSRLAKNKSTCNSEADGSLSCNRLASAVEIVSRCFATPSAQAPVWPYGLQQGSMLLTGVDSARRIAKTGKPCSIVIAGNRKNGKTMVRRICSLLDSEAVSIPSKYSKELLRSRAVDDFQVGLFSRIHHQTVVERRLPVEFFARSLRHAQLSSKTHALPGAVSCGPLEEYSEPTSSNSKDSALGSSHLKFNSGACCLPHPEKVQTGGEDAHFICEKLSAVGVADGVGGWADMGVDAGLYARELMKESANAILEVESEEELNPRTALKKAHSLTKSKGSSTACIIALCNDKLKAANLGDSGFVVIRNGRTLFKSPPQQHDFNFPYQLGSKGCDPPEMAEEYLFPVIAGDILVVGTDGLFDNLFDSELTSVVMHSVKAGWGPQDTAERIATLAHLRAQDPLRQSPFAKSAQEAGYRFWGGKMDDITVVVSFITSKDAKQLL